MVHGRRRPGAEKEPEKDHAVVAWLVIVNFGADQFLGARVQNLGDELLLRRRQPHSFATCPHDVADAQRARQGPAPPPPPPPPPPVRYPYHQIHLRSVAPQIYDRISSRVAVGHSLRVCGLDVGLLSVAIDAISFA
jgi:hypothetical protein